MLQFRMLHIFNSIQYAQEWLASLLSELSAQEWLK